MENNQIFPSQKMLDYCQTSLVKVTVYVKTAVTEASTVS